MMEAFLVRIRQQQQQQPQQQQQTPTPSSVIDTQSQFPRLPYLLDVVNCVQTRKDTRFQRQMRRRTDVRFRRDAGSQLVANSGGSQYVTNGAANANSTPIVAAPRFLLNAQSKQLIGNFGIAGCTAWCLLHVLYFCRHCFNVPLRIG